MLLHQHNTIFFMSKVRLRRNIGDIEIEVIFSTGDVPSL